MTLPVEIPSPAVITATSAKRLVTLNVAIPNASVVALTGTLLIGALLTGVILALLVVVAVTARFGTTAPAAFVTFTLINAVETPSAFTVGNEVVTTNVFAPPAPPPAPPAPVPTKFSVIGFAVVTPPAVAVILTTSAILLVSLTVNVTIPDAFVVKEDGVRTTSPLPVFVKLIGSLATAKLNASTAWAVTE